MAQQACGMKEAAQAALAQGRVAPADTAGLHQYLWQTCSGCRRDAAAGSAG